MLSTSAAGRTSRASAAGSVSATPVLDGEVVCLDARGRGNFKSLLFRREWPYFYAFDLLSVDGKNVREWPLVERKRRLRQLSLSVRTRLLYVDHVQARGRDFFEVACAHDLEGIVGKLATGRYHGDGTSTSWCKIKNPAYTQMTARHELFYRSGSHKRRPMLRVT